MTRESMIEVRGRYTGFQIEIPVREEFLRSEM